MQFSVQKNSCAISLTSIVVRAVCMTLICVSSSFSWAAIRLSTNWQSDAQTHNAPHPAISEADVFDAAVEKKASELSALPKSKAQVQAKYGEGFKLYIDKDLYYINVVMFTPKRYPGDVCTPKEQGNLCGEGQLQLSKAHLFFFNNQFENVGVYTLNISELNEYFVNALLGMGVYNKVRNELLVSLDYFPIDSKTNAKFSKLAKRTTLLVRLKVENGKILIEQDDSCLKNPNIVGSIPEARTVLSRCQEKIR
jgi:hypothetical protein